MKSRNFNLKPRSRSKFAVLCVKSPRLRLPAFLVHVPCLLASGLRRPLYCFPINEKRWGFFCTGVDGAGLCFLRCPCLPDFFLNFLHSHQTELVTSLDSSKGCTLEAPCITVYMLEAALSMGFVHHLSQSGLTQITFFTSWKLLFGLKNVKTCQNTWNEVHQFNNLSMGEAFSNHSLWAPHPLPTISRTVRPHLERGWNSELQWSHFCLRTFHSWTPSAPNLPKNGYVFEGIAKTGHWLLIFFVHCDSGRFVRQMCRNQWQHGKIKVGPFHHHCCPVLRGHVASLPSCQRKMLSSRNSTHNLCGWGSHQEPL